MRQGMCSSKRERRGYPRTTLQTFRKSSQLTVPCSRSAREEYESSSWSLYSLGSTSCLDAEQAAAAQLGGATGDGFLLRLSAAEKADAAVDAQSGSGGKGEG